LGLSDVIAGPRQSLWAEKMAAEINASRHFN
jgi:hypothetical protein